MSAEDQRRQKLRAHIKLLPDDLERLDLLGQVYGLSRSAVVRICIRAAADKLGLTKKLGEESIF